MKVKKNCGSIQMLRFAGAALAIALCMTLIFVFTSCDTVGDSADIESNVVTETDTETETPPVLELAAPVLQINPGRTGIQLSWDAVENAEEYVLFWSLNDHEVRIVDEKVSQEIYFAITGSNEYSHELVYGDFYTNSSDFPLDSRSSFSFNYMLVARAEGYTDGVSDIHYENYVDIFMTANIDFGSDIGSRAGFRLYEVVLDPDTQEPAVLYLLEELTGTTDENGLITFEVELERGINHGYTVFQDENDDGVMNTGDLVWGEGNGSHSYSYWPSPTNSNIVFEREWDGTLFPASSSFPTLPRLISAA